MRQIIARTTTAPVLCRRCICAPSRTYLVGVELADRRLSLHYRELPLPLHERGFRLLRCKPPRHLEPPSGSPQGVLSVVVVLAEQQQWRPSSTVLQVLYIVHAENSNTPVERGTWGSGAFTRRNDRQLLRVAESVKELRTSDGTSKKLAAVRRCTHARTRANQRW